MEKNTLNFEMFINEFEIITISIEPDFEKETFKIIGITLENDTMVQLDDLPSKTKDIVSKAGLNYFNYIINL